MKYLVLIAALLASIALQALLAQSAPLSDEWLSKNAQVINTDLPGKEDLQLLKKRNW